MTGRRLPLVEVPGPDPTLGSASEFASTGLPAFSPLAPVRDLRGRPLRDLRISVTDRCNFRCRYCMPREAFGKDFRFMPQPELLSFEEITRLGRVLHGLGVTKFRLTGGEPLLRRELHKLVRMLRALGAPGEIDLAMTTNGALLSEHAEVLREAGLDRVTVSLDALDPAKFQTINDTGATVDQVLAGISAAEASGLGVKVNCVVRRLVNDDQVLELATRFRHTHVALRFIEFMDVGSTNQWRPSEVVAGDEVLAAIHAHWPLEAVAEPRGGDTARRYRYLDGGGEIGLISSVSKPFCGQCTRARLSADGRLFTCLFATQGTDVRSELRRGLGDAALLRLVAQIWTTRRDAYSEEREALLDRAASLQELPPKIEMSYIGG